ncbi:hypothetical protein [Paraburkholderia domus]|uniref:hypothetical protein n=1 Tax=Paraburkholderia domus TaxID=2793075 RepID=UPI001911CB3E|nr:hypothetical protein [Paraburkholderia domus]MBK5066364.1 hypothetical protein [Burkholderia sp. R-70199]CAE6969671.1 hypothetical protein R70199_08099 [Paraburkholderia domus]
MGSLSIWHWLIVLLVIAFYLFPLTRILKKAGFSGWFCLLAVVPLVNLLAFWAFAFIEWPVERRSR